MAGKIHDQRHFIMFEREDQGFEYGQSPSGYVKIEVRGGKGKLSAMAQNLKYSDNLLYRVYLIRCSEYELLPVDTGIMQMKKNSFEADWSFNPERVGELGYSIDEFNVAAIIAEYNDRKKLHIECPLAAYRGKKINWRRRLEEYLTVPFLKQQPDVVESLNNSVEPDIQEKEEVVQTDDKIIESMETVNNNAVDIFSGTEQIQEEKNEVSETSLNTDQDLMPDKATEDSPSISDEEYNEEFGKGCIYKENNTCGFKQGTMGFYNPCIYCNIGADAQNRQHTNRSSGSADSLGKNLDKYFEAFDPFGSKRKDYKWWKVNNPVYLNNVLYQCNIKTPLLFNPKVMLAHFKYKHLIVGIYTDRMRRREFIVCGVPGVYSVDEKPFGDMCRWVQLEGNRPKHGAFGYWLVYMDSRTGKFINLG